MRAAIVRYYVERLRRFGATPLGVDWNSLESQALRFSRLLTLVDGAAKTTLIDYGCGYGALADQPRVRETAVSYQGFDISDEMVRAARASHAGDPWCVFTSNASALRRADYVVASGVFNVKLDHPIEEWRDYVIDILNDLDALSDRGFGFNMLSTYSDPEKRRDDLYYADPLELFDICKRRFSPRVALLHDYPLYEFTLVVRK